MYKISYIITIAFILLSCQNNEQLARNNSQPNVLLILADDLGYSDLGCYGSEIKTRNLDQLAKNGIRFTQFYNCAKCSPSRAALLTGQYPHEAGVGDVVATPKRIRKSGAYQGYLKGDSIMTIAEILKKGGYQTYMSGKWHVGEAKQHWPTTRGFDQYFGLISGASSYFEIIKDQPRVRVMAKNTTEWIPPTEGFYMTDAITDAAIENINLHFEEQEARPFFQYIAYTAPHWPLHALKEDIEKYEGIYDEGWDHIRKKRYESLKSFRLIPDLAQLPEKTATIPDWLDVKKKELWARRMQVYAAMIDRMDQGIGRILTTLKKNSAFENTIIIFLSDNGASAENIAKRGLNDPVVPIGLKGSYAAYREPWANVSDTPFRKYKLWLHEGGISTPLILHYPNGDFEVGGIRHQPAHLIDIVPTFLEIAQVSYPKQNQGSKTNPLSGTSLLSAIRANTALDRPLFWEYSGHRAMREKNWKLIRPKKGEWELYDLAKDRSELHNLAVEMPNKVADMVAAWESWAKGVGVYDAKK